MCTCIRVSVCTPTSVGAPACCLALLRSSGGHSSVCRHGNIPQFVLYHQPLEYLVTLGTLAKIAQTSYEVDELRAIGSVWHHSGLTARWRLILVTVHVTDIAEPGDKDNMNHPLLAQVQGYSRTCEDGWGAHTVISMLHIFLLPLVKLQVL